MAAELDDFMPSTVQHVMYQYFLQQTAPVSTWRALLDRYVGFLPLLARAAVVTLEVSILGMVVAIIVGLGLAIARRYGKRIVATTAVGIIETIRGTPLLIQILFVFYGLPNIGIKLDPFVAGVLALGLNYAAYEAENYRAGLEAIPRGQMEAAVALDLTQAQALRLVIVPQAFRIVIPVMTNDFISLLKDSSLVSVITMAELTRTYEQLSTTYYDYFGTGLLVGAVYLLIGLPFVRLARWTERRLNVDARVRRPVSSAFAAR
jgi:polar amino acid transport system substrate-binding protein